MPKGDLQRLAENEAAGRIVRGLRESLRLSQTEFRNYLRVRLGIPTEHPSTISRWEHGKATVPGALIVHALDRLGIETVNRIAASGTRPALASQNLTVPYLPIAA